MQENYAWNPSTWACECDKHYAIDEYLRNCNYVNSITDDSIIIWDYILDTLQTFSIDPNEKMADIKWALIF